MSFIAIHTYDGDPAEYIDHNEPGTIGTRVEEQTYHDGEELDAAKAIMGLLSERTHFDVRMWND